MTSTVVRPKTADEETEVAAWPAAAPESRAVWPATLLSMLLVAALLTLLFVRNHRYFYIDDRISETVPKFVDMGRILSSGQMPWLSTNIVNGGGYAAEYLNGVYNPLNLALSLMLSQLQDVAFGSFLYVLAHCMLGTAAAAWLARTLGLNTWWSVAVAVSVGFNPYTMLWNATAWSQGLIAFSWFLVAVAAIVAFHLRPRHRYGWTILFGTYGCLTSGWPLAVVVLGFFVAALLVARLVGRSPLRGTAWLAAWSAGGALCSLVAIYPLLSVFEIADRSSSISNVANFNVAPVEGLLQFANPGYYGFFSNFNGNVLQRLPHFYAAWFLLPVFVLVRPGRLRPALQTLLYAVLATLALSALSTLGPERLLVLRFPTRSLQYYQFFLLVLAALLVAHGRFVFSGRRLAVLLSLIGLTAINALQADPTGVSRALLAAAAVGGLSVLVWQRGRPHRAQVSGNARTGVIVNATVVLGTVGMLAGLALVHPSGRGVDWGFPHDVTAVAPLSTEDYTLYYGEYLPAGSGIAGFREFHPATMGLTVGDRQVNGYSSLGNRLFRRWFPIDDQGNFHPGGASQFSQVDPVSGLQMLELMRVDQVITVLGPMEDDLRSAIGDGWRRERAGQFTAVYRHADYTLPGLVSWASPGSRVSEANDCERTHSRECVLVDNRTDGAGEVVFARMWLPGYRATLDGEPVPVQRHSDLFVSVVTPPDAKGRIVLTYRPPGTVPLTALAVLVLAGLGGVSSRIAAVRSETAPGRRQRSRTLTDPRGR